MTLYTYVHALILFSLYFWHIYGAVIRVGQFHTWRADRLIRLIILLVLMC